MWIVFAWVVFCWIIGTFTRTLVGVGLFFAPIVGVIAAGITESTKAGWLAAAVTIFLPIIIHIDRKEREEAEKQTQKEAEAARHVEAEKRRRIEADVNEAYEVLEELPENEEAKQLCQDYIDFYCNDAMEPEIKYAFENKITEFARPFIETRNLKEIEEEDKREKLRQAEIETTNLVLRKRYIENT